MSSPISFLDGIRERVQPKAVAARPTGATELGATAAAATETRTPTERPGVHWRRLVLEATAMWGATRIAMLLLTYASTAMSQAGYSSGYVAHGLRGLVDAWNHWDAQWYIGIAQGGYTSPQSSAFFPLYPLTIKFVSLFLGQHWVIAALIAGNLGTLGAFIGVGFLAAGETRTREGGQRAIRMLAAYPLAFFLAAPYSEGMFLGFAAASLFCARQGKWRWAAAWAFLGAATRPTAVILILPLVWEYGRQQQWWQLGGWRTRIGVLRQPRGVAESFRTVFMAARSRSFVDFVLAAASVPVAIGLYAVYCWYQFGHPLIFLNAQRIYWHRVSEPLWSTLAGSTRLVFLLPELSYWQFRLLVDLAPLLLYICITLLTIRRVPFMFTLYMFGLFYLALATPVVHRLEPDPIFSAGRFLAESAPLFVLFGQWTAKRPWLDLLLVSSGFMLQAILGMFYLRGGWMI